jgi:hypothetical protein
MNKYFPGLLFLLFFGSCAAEQTEESSALGWETVSEITLQVMEELLVLDYQATKDLYLGYSFNNEEIVLFNSEGEVKHQWAAPESGSAGDYGRIYGISFFDEESLLVLSLFRGLHRIDFSGNILEEIDLPFQPAITGYSVKKKAIRLDDTHYLLDLPGRVNPFDQIENKYDAPLYELWNTANGEFQPLVRIPEESKYRKFNVINYPTFTFSEGKLYHVNDNEPVVYVYTYSGSGFLFERSIALNPPQFYEPKESLLDEDDEFYEAENYLLEVHDGHLYIFYTSGIAPEVYKENLIDENFDQLFAEHEHKWVASVNLANDRIQYLQLPPELDYVQTLGPDGLFAVRKNLYYSEDETDTNRFLLLRFKP